MGERTEQARRLPRRRVSRKLDQPLAVIIQSTPAAGKTTLMEAILAFVPPEDVVKFQRHDRAIPLLHGRANLKHKILAIVEEEGAPEGQLRPEAAPERGRIAIASTGKEASSGRLMTQEYRVEGPVMIFLTTTTIKVDEELLNRCLVLTVDEDREQTRPSISCSGTGKPCRVCCRPRITADAEAAPQRPAAAAAAAGRQPLRRAV